MSMRDVDIRDAIVSRLEAIAGSCNSSHIDHNDGVLRGLIWALTGEDPGTYLLKDTEKLLKLAGIRCYKVGETVHWDWSPVRFS